MDCLVVCPRCNGQKKLVGDSDPCFMCNGKGYLRDIVKRSIVIGGSSYPTTSKGDENA